MRKSILILFALLLVGLNACSKKLDIKTPSSPENLKSSMSFSILNLKTSIGRYERKKNTEILSFSFQLKNLDSQDTTVQSITPLYKPELKEKITEDPKKAFKVNQLLRSGDSVTIKGEILFNATNVSSETINSWKPYIIGFKILNEKIVR